MKKLNNIFLNINYNKAFKKDYKMVLKLKIKFRITKYPHQRRFTELNVNRKEIITYESDEILVDQLTDLYTQLDKDTGEIISLSSLEAYLEKRGLFERQSSDFYDITIVKARVKDYPNYRNELEYMQRKNQPSLDDQLLIESEFENNEDNTIYDRTINDYLTESSELQKKWTKLQKRKKRVFVGGLSKTTQKYQLNVLMKKFGNVIDINLPKEKKSGIGLSRDRARLNYNRGYAFVTYLDFDFKTTFGDVEKYKLKLNNKDIYISPWHFYESSDTRF